MGFRYETNCIPMVAHHNRNQRTLAVGLFISIAAHILILARVPYPFQIKPLFSRYHTIELLRSAGGGFH